MIIPNYNYSKYLSKCLESIEIQTVQPASVILIDDCSSDNSIMIAKSFKKKIKNLKIIKKKKNQGLYKNLNNEIKITKEKLIYFMSSDDFISKNLFFETFKIFSKYTDLKFCSFQTQYVDSINRNLKNKNNFYSKYNGFLSKDEFLKKFKNLSMNYQTNGIIFNNDVFQHLKFPNFGSLSDSALVYLLASQYGGYFSDKKLSFFRIHKKNYSSFKIRQKKERYQNIINIEKWLKINYPNKMINKEKVIRLWKNKEINNFKMNYYDFIFKRAKKNNKLRAYIIFLRLKIIFNVSLFYFFKVLCNKLIK